MLQFMSIIERGAHWPQIGYNLASEQDMHMQKFVQNLYTNA